MLVGCVQSIVGGTLEENLQNAWRLISQGIDQGVEIFVLPEYFSYQSPGYSEHVAEITKSSLKEWSREGILVTGNAIKTEKGEFYNTAYLFYNGKKIGEQKKLHPTEIEREYNINSGNALGTFTFKGITISVLICADILYPELCRVAGLKGVDLVLNPVVSFQNSDFPPEPYKDCLYFIRSFDNAYYVAKAGGTGRSPCGDPLAGRSLISSPEGIIAKYRDESSPELIIGEIDPALVRGFREKNYSLKDRNIRAYQPLVDPQSSR
jgi:predicted amidohydrolase